MHSTLITLTWEEFSGLVIQIYFTQGYQLHQILLKMSFKKKKKKSSIHFETLKFQNMVSLWNINKIADILPRTLTYICSYNLQFLPCALANIQCLYIPAHLFCWQISVDLRHLVLTKFSQFSRQLQKNNYLYAMINVHLYKVNYSICVKMLTVHNPWHFIYDHFGCKRHI